MRARKTSVCAFAACVALAILLTGCELMEVHHTLAAWNKSRDTLDVYKNDRLVDSLAPGDNGKYEYDKGDVMRVINRRTGEVRGSFEGTTDPDDMTHGYSRFYYDDRIEGASWSIG